jgi:hypothetical protein
MFRSGFLLFIALIISVPALARQSCEWPFRTQINVQENSGSGSQLQDYQVEFKIDASDLSSDYDWSNNGEDLYIYDFDDQTELEFWIDTWDSSTQEATIWIRFPTLDRGQTRTIYFYYGNENVPAAGDVPFTFTYPGIKFHTRNSASDPNNLSQALTAFDASNDQDTRYGCGFITNFDGITNSSQFGNSNSNFAAYSESYFLVEPGEEGFWRFRYGADFGHGGGLYVNGTALEEQWNDNLWWANNWNLSNEVLLGGITLVAGYHKIEVLGFEDCCDGGITVQFRKPNGNWTTFATTSIDVRSRACPVEQEPTFTVIGHDVCEIDLGFDNRLSYPNGWVANDTRPVSFAIENLSTIHPSLPDTRVAVTLGAGLSLVSSVGTNWNCSTESTSSSSTELSCLYSQAITASGASSSLLTLNVSSTDANTSSSFTATVYSKQFEEQLVNNQISRTLPVWQLINDVSTSCATTSSGVYVRFYSSLNYSDDTANSEAEFDNWENDLSIRSKLYGHTVLSQINSNTGNPFDLANNDFYLALLEGYLYIPEDGFYNVAVDGDDAIEFKLNDVVYSSWYGAHGTQGGPRDENTIGLSRGFHKLNYRMQERTGGNSFYAYWRKPSESVTTIIPSSAFFHCEGSADIQLSMSIEIQDSPAIPGSNDKAIPGAVLRYQLTGDNKSMISSSTDSVVISQKISDNLSLFVDSINLGIPNTSPIAFVDSTGIESSGLSFGVLSYSNNNGVNFNYTPVPDTDGYDSNITDFELSLNGSMLPKDTSITPNTIPSFNIIYQVKVK